MCPEGSQARESVHEAGRSHDRSGGRVGKFEPVVSTTEEQQSPLNSRFRPIRGRRIRCRHHAGHLAQSIPEVPSCARNRSINQPTPLGVNLELSLVCRFYGFLFLVKVALKAFPY